MIYLGADHGNDSFKSSNNVRYYSGVKEVINITGMDSDSNIVGYDGKTYLVGESRNAMQRDKTLNNNMLIQTLPAIGKKIKEEHEPHEQSVALGIGVPLTQMRNLRESYVNYFLGKKVDFTYNGEEYCINFVQVRCYPQGYSAMLHNYKELAGAKEYLVIDIGGGTVDAFKIVGKQKDMTTFRTFNMGTVHLANRIRTEFDADGINISDNMLESAVLGEKILHKRAEYIERTCTSFTSAYVDELLGQLKTTYDMSLPVVWVGGGYQLFKGYIQKDDSIYIFKEFDAFANAKAYEWLIREGK